MSVGLLAGLGSVQYRDGSASAAGRTAVVQSHDRAEVDAHVDVDPFTTEGVIGDFAVQEWEQV
jgi:uncharacterized protein YciI